MMLQISYNPSFRDLTNIDRFAAPIATSFRTPSLSHDSLVSPILPGNEFFYIARFVDADGGWQSVTGKSRTKQRTVTIDFDVLHIINDGALGDTTADFRMWVMEGDTAIKSYFFGDIDNFKISDRPGKNIDWEFIGLTVGGRAPCASCVIGPKDITNDNHDIGLLVRGLYHRNSPTKNQHANNFGLGDNFPNPKADVPQRAKFIFPTGADEIVNHQPLIVEAIPRTADVEFHFDVRASISVNYT